MNAGTPTARRLAGGLVMVLAVAITASGCRSTAVAPDSSREPQELHLRSGDHIRLVTTRRERYSIEISEIRETELVGVTLSPGAHEPSPRGQRVTVPYDQLALVEVRRFSATYTAGTVLVIGLLGVLVASVAVVGLPPPVQ